MDHFDDDRRLEIDKLSFKILTQAFNGDALKTLAGHNYHFSSPIPKGIIAGAFEWLDDISFGRQRVSFYSRRVQHAYVDFADQCASLWHEIVTAYSADGGNNLIVNYIDLSSVQKTELSEKLGSLATKTLAACENLFTVASHEFK